MSVTHCWWQGCYLPVCGITKSIVTIKDYKQLILEQIIPQKLPNNRVSINDFFCVGGVEYDHTPARLYDHDDFVPSETYHIILLSFPMSIYVGYYKINVIWNTFSVLDIKKVLEQQEIIYIKNQEISYDNHIPLKDDIKLIDINPPPMSGSYASIAFDLNIKTNNELLQPIFIINKNFYDTQNMKQSKIKVLNKIFPKSISLIIYTYSIIDEKILQFVNLSNSINQEIIPFDNCNLFLSYYNTTIFNANRQRLLNTSKTFESYKIQSKSNIYLYYNNKINIKVKCPFFCDNKSLIFSINQHDNTETIAKLFQNWLNQNQNKQIMEYNNRFDKLFSSLNTSNNDILMLNGRIQKGVIAKIKNLSKSTQYNNEKVEIIKYVQNFLWKVKLLNYKGTKYLSVKKDNLFVIFDINKHDNAFKIHRYEIYKQPKNLNINFKDILNETYFLKPFGKFVNITDNETFLIQPILSLKLILINYDKKEEYLIMDYWSRYHRSFDLYSIIAKKLNVNINGLLLFILKSNKENDKIILECNETKSIVDYYQILMNKICIYYEIHNELNFDYCNKLKNAKYPNYKRFQIFLGEFMSSHFLFTLCVSSNWTVKQLKESIEINFDIPANIQQLQIRSGHGRYLVDEQKLSFYRMENGSEVSVRLTH